MYAAPRPQTAALASAANGNLGITHVRRGEREEDKNREQGRERERERGEGGTHGPHLGPNRQRTAAQSSLSVR